jgi:hypothetical protein
MGRRACAAEASSTRRYAASASAWIKGVKIRSSPRPSKVVVNFDRTGNSVAAINKRLLRQGIIGKV